MSRKDIRVPDIGDFRDVPVIEILVKPGATIAKEDALLTLESDKASFDVPSPEGGTVVDVLVKVGDRVSEGTAIVVLESSETKLAELPPVETRAEPRPHAPAPTQGKAQGSKEKRSAADHECDVLVLGAGPGGYSAAFRAADLGARTILVERWPVLGGVCLNVGCIPSKALLHTAGVIEAARSLAQHGVRFGAPEIDLKALAAFKNGVIAKLTNGLAGIAKERKVTTLTGQGTFIDDHHLKVMSGTEETIIRFENAIIAAGSEAMRLPFLPDDPRIVDSTGALELRQAPKTMLVIGGGIIGLEMATVYSALCARVDVAEILGELMTGTDRDLVAVWQKFNARRFDRIMLNTRVVAAEAKRDGIAVTFDGANAPSETLHYDLVLVAVGRKPNGNAIGAENAGVRLSERGFIAVDREMRTNVRHIFAIGDIAAEPMLAHKAVHEGHVAAENAAGKRSSFDARQIPSVAYTDPEIAWTGLTETDAKARGIPVRKAIFPWSASGRALGNGRDEGFTKLLFDPETERILGGGIVGTEAGNLISEIGLAIEMEADAVDIGRTIHPHPTLSESIGMAADVFEGICTDSPPQKHG